MSDSVDIVVIGYLPSAWVGGSTGPGGGGGNPPYGDSDSADGGTVFVGNMGWYPPEGSDEAEIRVDLNVNRQLTSDELAAFEHFFSKIDEATTTINSLSDNHKMTLANGKQVTGGELKALWSKADFTINDVGHQYANGTFRGESDFNNGDPEISFNISTLKSYSESSSAGAMEFLLFHELGHLAPQAQVYNRDMYSDGVASPFELRTNEQMANDVALALANFGQHAVYYDAVNQNSGLSTDFLIQ